MSLVDKSRPTTEAEIQPGSPEDPFRLGWRNVSRTLPDGEVEYDQVPLTLEDLLFPEEEDFAVQLQSHVEDCYYLYGALKIKFAEVPGALVLSDHRVRFDVPDLKPLGPDVALFFDVDEDWDTGTFEVAQLAARATLVVEVTSPDTRGNDVGIKKEFYHQAGVAFYLVVDSRIHQGLREDVQLFGFRHTPEGYEPIPLDADQILWVESLGLGFRIEDNQVRCFDGRDGRVIDPPVAMALARKAAEERAEAAEERAQAEMTARQAAEARAEAAEARLRIAEARAESAERQVQAAQRQVQAAERQVQAVNQQVQAAQRQVQAAQRQVQAQAEAQLAYDARLAALEAGFRRLQGGS